MSDIPGRIAQGDIFFVEGDGDVKVPVLIVVDEASQFLYMDAFEEAVQRAKNSRVMVKASELQEAFVNMLKTWGGAGNELAVVRFDRESAVPSSAVSDWLKGAGVEVVLTTAGQNLTDI